MSNTKTLFTQGNPLLI